MNTAVIEANIQYTFANQNYPKGKKSRILKNVKQDAKAENLAKVGQTLSSLQGDSLLAATIITKSAIDLNQE
jgi:hypothetical protein